ncbi:MAG: cytochrome c3 family protein [Minicystis sp.]
MPAEHRSTRVLHGALVLALAVAGCASVAAPPRPPSAGGSVVTSNVERRDYVGSDRCAGCHARIYEAWRASPMRNMTRLAPERGEPVIRAPFDGSAFHFKGDTVTAFAQEGRRYLRVEAQGRPAQLFRVTKVIGGRYREDYVGREVAGTAADSAAVGDPSDEPILPVSYLLFAKSWRYKGYSVMVKERPHLGKHGAPWKQTCIFCHNTAPYLATVYDDLLGGGRTYQGSVSDRFLPEDRLWKTKVADAAGLARAASAEVSYLGADPPPPGADARDALEAVIAATMDRFGEPHVVEVGIGCEACHNGAREHVDDPYKLPSFAPRSPLLTAITPNPARRGATPGRAEEINHVCARCHTVLFSRYPFTWEGGVRPRDASARPSAKHPPPGGSTINSGEARDFLLGACTTALACSACHDPHTEDRRADLDRMGTVAGNGACTRCHDGYRAPDALRAHTHHAPDGDGSACLGCHMPRKNTGLGYRLTRYHRIGSPTDPARVERDRPVECALCHADKPVAALVETMERWWSKRYDRAALRRLYGDDLGVNALLATLALGKPHEQIAAAGVLGERGSRKDAAALVPLMASDYPLVRYYAGHAAERLLGRPVPVDLDGEAKVIHSEAAAFVSQALAEERR